jgi:hypothetical protein
MFFEPLDQFFIFRVLKGCSSRFFNIDNVSLIVILNFVVIILWVMIP